jgi:D-inositol-3-phosphate glycosyltransferase
MAWMSLLGEAPRLRVAMISLHTSPLDPPGIGDSGGMNVYVRSVAKRLAERGVAVDVFTRCEGRAVPEVEAIGDLLRVIQVPAGPCAPVRKDKVAQLLPEFSRALLARRELEGIHYDLVHAHYWLSGSAAEVTKARWAVPLVASFHTLGRVKNRALDEGSREPPQRLRVEHSVIAEADRILAPTPAEAAHLIELYGADHRRIRLVPPGVDLDRFRPGNAVAAKVRLGLGGKRVVLFVGRLQKLKGPDVAIRAVAEAIRAHPAATEGLELVLVGGPSGGEDRILEATRLMELAATENVSERVHFYPPVPHEELPDIYAAADVLLAPSRSESFGLVALEAQACGVPVVAAAVGGLPYVVADGTTGLLVPGEDPRAYAERLIAVLTDPPLARRLSANGTARAAGYSWDLTTDRMISVYSELLPVAGVSMPQVAGSLAR